LFKFSVFSVGKSRKLSVGPLTKPVAAWLMYIRQILVALAWQTTWSVSGRKAV
jgi:hypothetical protein